MKSEYDFSKGERGKFYHPDAEFHLPIYLDPDVASFMHQLAAKKDTDVGQIVNDWLRTNIGALQTVE